MVAKHSTAAVRNPVAVRSWRRPPGRGPDTPKLPVMILFMENAALNAVREYLEPNESVVGTGVNLRHLAATPVGHRVTAEAEVTKVDGRRIEFKVSARDENEVIGTGTHERFVVDLTRLDQRLAAKAKR